MAQKFRKNDQVIIISGSDRGKIGKILSFFKTKVILEGLNLATVHKKPTSSSAGQIIKIERPIHISNISHVEDGKAIKIKFMTDPSEEKNFAVKSRVSRKSGKKIV
jgi:large subunit ribosomal protein L24